MSDNPYQPEKPYQPQSSEQPYQSPYQPPYQQPNYQQPNYQQPNYQQPNYQQPNYQQPYQSPYQQDYQKAPYPAYQSAYQKPSKTQFLSIDFSLAGALCYVPFFAVNLIASVIFLVTEPKGSIFVRFHAMQSLLLTAMGTVLAVIMGIVWFFMVIVGASMGNEAGGVMAVLSSLGLFGLIGIFSLAIFIMHFVGMYKAYNNEMWEIPVIGKYARRLSQ